MSPAKRGRAHEPVSAAQRSPPTSSSPKPDLIEVLPGPFGVIADIRRTYAAALVRSLIGADFDLIATFAPPLYSVVLPAYASSLSPQPGRTEALSFSLTESRSWARSWATP